MASDKWQEMLQFYDDLVAECPRFERKGKTMPYTSANGYMFSLLNKDAELGIRFSSEVQNAYIESIPTTLYKSYGAIMHGYVLIPETLRKEPKKLVGMLNESYEYVMTLPPK
ncbi:MAG: hypothetical protein OEQ81_11100 [Flavobacteriaceae bacterium]|nr:hypothetical protein [Flavobacteriaceae bacterium]